MRRETNPAAGAFGRRFLVDFGAEMDGSWSRGSGFRERGADCQSAPPFWKPFSHFTAASSEVKSFVGYLGLLMPR